MKLNKFLAVAVAATVLPLSVAHAEGPVVHDVPEFKGGVNGPGLVNEKPDYGEKLVAPEALNKDRVYLGEDGKLHAYEGVNGPGAVHGVKPYGTSLVAPEVHTKPEFKLPTQGSNDTFGPRKGQAPAKAQNGQKVLPKTSAVK
ncbi:SIALI-17 repeat-containing surface protein [uncultured Gemella sp.]|uniref:SIALI-17 repeat-containing surface protein n=1 Tax=uncultured Gemella sp. TaxID=254352 RepID=UPI0028D69B60|nr:SIALI-17 repeat-containing surface protein [uncultured Gemella sp.]